MNIYKVNGHYYWEGLGEKAGKNLHLQSRDIREGGWTWHGSDRENAWMTYSTNQAELSARIYGIEIEVLD